MKIVFNNINTVIDDDVINNTILSLTTDINDKTLNFSFMNCNLFRSLDLSKLDLDNFILQEIIIDNCDNFKTLIPPLSKITCQKLTLANLPNLLTIPKEIFTNIHYTSDIRIVECIQLNAIPSFKNQDCNIYIDNIAVNNIKGLLKNITVQKSNQINITLKNLSKLSTIEKTLFQNLDVDNYNLIIDNCSNFDIPEITGKFRELAIKNCHISNSFTYHGSKLSDLFFISYGYKKEESNYTSLDLQNNYIKNVNLSGEFRTINLNYNLLKDIDLSQVKFKSIYLQNNYLTNIIFGKDNLDLDSIDLDNNLLTSLIIPNVNFLQLSIRRNPLHELITFSSKRSYISGTFYNNFPIFSGNSELKTLMPGYKSKIVDNSPIIESYVIDNNLPISEIIKKLRHIRDRVNLNINNVVVYNNIDNTDPGCLNLVPIDNENINFVVKRKQLLNDNNKIILPSISSLKLLTLDDLIVRLSVFTTSELNRAYGPFIYTNIVDICNQIYVKIHDLQMFYLYSPNEDKLDIYNYQDNNGDYSNIYLYFKDTDNKINTITIKDIILNSYFDSSGEIIINNPRYKYVDYDDYDYDEVRIAEALRNLNQDIPKNLDFFQIKELYNTINITTDNRFKGNCYHSIGYRINHGILGNYLSKLDNFIKETEKNNFYLEYRSRYLNFSDNVKLEIKNFLWEFFIYVIWSRHWKGWLYDFPLDYNKENVCRNQERFRNFRVNQFIVNNLYNNLSLQALDFINKLPVIYYRFKQNYNIDPKYKTISHIINYINSDNCIGMIGDTMIGTAYINICFVLLTDNYKLDDKSRLVLEKDFNNNLITMTLYLVNLEIEELNKEISEFNRDYENIYQGQLNKLLNDKDAVINTDKIIGKRNFKRQQRRILRLEETLKFGHQQPHYFYANDIRIKRATHFSSEKL